MIGYELRFGGAIDLGDPARTPRRPRHSWSRRSATSASRRWPAATPPGSRSPATSSSRSARRRCARTARCCRSRPTPHATTCSELQELSRSGYTMALDDYDGRTTLEELMSLCSIVKVDVADRAATSCRASSRPAHPGRAARRHRRRRPRRLRALPRPRLHLLPGRVLRQAAPFTHRGVATAGLGSLRRLSELTAGDVSFEDLERIIASDIGLSLKLLRYVNSAFFALPRTVGSVREALSLLGVRTVRRWATVMVISAIPDVPDELVALGLRRARMCEMLAGTARRGGGDALHGRPVLRRRRAARRADGRRPRLAAVHRRDPDGAAAPRGSQGRAARRRPGLRARRVPDAARPTPASSSPAPTAPRSSGRTRLGARSLSGGFLPFRRASLRGGYSLHYGDESDCLGDSIISRWGWHGKVSSQELFRADPLLRASSNGRL